MAERIDVPPTLQGDEKAQLQQVWSYLYQLSEAINNNLDGIGGNELTDSERKTMQLILSAGEKAPELSEMETLKSLIIKTADFVQTSLQEYRMNLLGETVASGKFGRYVRSTGLDVAVTPEGITQNYSFQEIIQGLKVYEIYAKNYIKTGLLRTVNSLPVYGVAIGKDVVTFSEDGTETYNDGNKVAELTADELSFWQNGVKVAGYTGSRISFYYNGAEAFYIQNGELYCVGKLEMKSGSTFKIASGGNIDINGTGTLNLTGSTVSIKSGSTFDVESTNFKIDSTSKKLKTGEWSLEEKGLIAKYYNPTHATDCNILFGRNIEAFPNEPLVYMVSAVSTLINSKYSCGHALGIRQPGSTIDDIYLNISIVPGLNPPFLSLTATHLLNYESVDMASALGASNNKWDIYGKNVYYTWTGGYSSREIKHNIKNMLPMGEKLDRLQPVTFVYDDDTGERQRMGLIYEDTVEVMPEICTRDESNKAISYIELVPALLKEIQDLRKRVAELERRVDDVQGA